MARRNELLDRATLPQYMSNEDIYLRFLKELNDPDSTMSVPARGAGRIIPTKAGVSAQNLDWFLDRSTELSNEFYTDLKEQIGTSKASFFIGLIRGAWSDGMSQRKGPDLRNLKTSIKLHVDNIRQPPHAFDPIWKLDQVDPSLTPNDVADILSLNERILIHTIDDWVEAVNTERDFSRDDIYISRGLALKQALPEHPAMPEYDYISSYSMAISIAEKFCQQPSGPLRAIVHTKLDSFSNRVLFFSPFISGMVPDQFELGIVPGRKPDLLICDGIHSGIHEYRLEPEAFE